jgi:dolichol-phosphate mannosyltransferase
MRTLIIIPTYLEVQNIQDLLARVRECVPAADILVVDDNSPDGTAEAAKAAAAELGHIEVIVKPDKGGLGVAYRAGFAHAFDQGYDAVVQMDADFSHDPAALPELLGRLEAGADVAIGSRYCPGGNIPNWPRFRRLLSRGANLYAATVLGLPVRDATAGFRAYRADVLRVVQSHSTRATGYGFQVELSYRAHRLGAKVVEVPITFNDRVRGVSKMSKHIVGEAAWLVTSWGLRDWVLGRRRRPEVDQATGAAPAAATPSDP